MVTERNNKNRPEAVVLELTPERKERMRRAAQGIREILEKQVPDLAETFYVLSMVTQAFERAHGVTLNGSISLGAKDIGDS